MEDTTSDSPAAKNQRLDISDGQLDQDVSKTDHSNGREGETPQKSATDLSTTSTTSEGHFNQSPLSDSQLDGQVDHDIRKSELLSPCEPSGILQNDKDEEEQVKSFAEPKKSKSSEESDIVHDDSEANAVVAVANAASALAPERNSIYDVKWIGWRRNTSDPLRRIGIITQNENGPCPLLSIVNVLLLRGKLSLPEGCEVISAEQLLEFLGEIISESIPGNVNEATRLDYEQNLADAMCTLPKLQTGLDVNVHFTGVSKFEYTPECIIFDLLNIPLYHGWLIDPQQEEVCTAVNLASYNQLVEMIIANKTSKDSELVSHSITAQQFLEESASQLTYHGLYELNATMKDGELAVFFRNNHFSTIYKRKQELFLLVTDQGFLKEPRVVWETLNTIDGDIQFVDENFLTVTPAADDGSDEKNRPEAAAMAGAPQTEDQQIDQDLQLAMTLASQEESEFGDWEEFKRTHLGDTTGLTDEQLAQRLQAAEDLAAQQQLEQQQQQQQQQQQANQQRGRESGESRRGRGHGGRPDDPPQRAEKSKNCAIL